MMMNATEYRFAEFEFRAEGDRAIVEGAAMPYGTEANIAGLFRETVEPGAFAGRMGDVIANLMHNRDEPLGRTDGGGLTLTDSTDRLRARLELPEYRADVADMVKRRILRGFSVEMRVTDEDWPAPDKRIIRAAELSAIGLVDRPAYGEATAAIAQRMKGSTRHWPVVL